MSKFEKGPIARTHEEARRIVCCCCGKKCKCIKNTGSAFIVTERFSGLVRRFVEATYSDQNPEHPVALCDSCRLALSAHEKNPEKPARKLPQLLSYSELIPPPPTTRSSATSSCPCTLCSIAGLYGQAHIDYMAMQTNKVGRPSERVDSDSESEAMLVCKSCLSEIAPGKEHKCQKTRKRENIVNLIRNSSEGSKSSVLVQSLREVAETQGETTRGGTIKLQSGSHTIPVQLGNKRTREKTPKFSHENLKNLGKRLNLSNTSLIKVGEAVRTVFGRKSVESGVPQALTRQSTLLEDYFDEFEFEGELGASDKANSKKVGVYCTDVEGLVAKVIEERGLSVHSTDLHIGMDLGQGSLKLALILTDRSKEDKTGRAHYSDGVASRQAKDSSVKKLLLLAVLPDCAESHASVKLLLDMVGLSKTEYVFSGDLKMCNLVVGKSVGKLTHGCCFCDASTPYSEPGNLYSLGELQELSQAFREAGANLKRQKEFDNVVKDPVLTSEDPNQLVLGMIAIPELHLLIGIIDKLLKSIEDNICNTKEEGLDFMDGYLKKVCILRKSFRGSHSLEGNQSRQFLKKLDVLEDYMRSSSFDILKKGEPFLKAFREFDLVVNSCFGNTLLPGYQAHILNFKKAYTALDISITPKAHIVFEHVQQFLEIINEDTDHPKGLGYFSEQAFEAMHHNTKVEWEKVKVSINNPNFGKTLKKFIISINSKNI